MEQIALASRAGQLRLSSKRLIRERLEDRRMKHLVGGIEQNQADVFDRRQSWQLVEDRLQCEPRCRFHWVRNGI